MNNKEKEMKKEKIKPILETLEDLMEEDWDEAKEFLHSLDEIYWIDNYYSLAIIDKLSYYFGEMDDYDLDLIPELFWEDRQNALEAFDIIYDWIDESLWDDGDFVIDVLRIDFTESTLNRMSEELKSNDDFLQVVADELLEDIDDIKEQIY